MKERRRYPRYEATGLTGLLDGRYEVPVLNLSLGGMLIRMRLKPPIATRFDFELPLGDTTFRAPGRVVFVGPDAVTEGQQVRVGIAFADLSDGERRSLADYLRRTFGGDPTGS